MLELLSSSSPSFACGVTAFELVVSKMEAGTLITDLRQLLLTIHSNPWPELPNPPNCKKRASVACVIRIRPRYPDIPTTTDSPSLPAVTSIHDDSYVSQLDHFFSLPWVKRGTPEILFIKRAARRGDRWTSHVALPGGRRDPSDGSDVAAAVRETMEEVGIDLSTAVTDSSSPDNPESSNAEGMQHVHPDPHGQGPEPTGGSQETGSDKSPSALLAGALPQRLITTDFGAVPLMVLCPFVFLLTSPDPTAQLLRLQPTEVGSAHWVPIHALLDPVARTHERADFVDRLAARWGLKWGGMVARWALRLSLGQVLYSAIRLAPSESLFSDDEEELRRTDVSLGAGNQESLMRKLAEVIIDDAPWIHRLFSGTSDGYSPDPRRSLLLWGLTHGIISDLLGLLPSRKGLTWWRWPTLSRPDIRLMTWVLSYRFRKTKTKALRQPEESQEEIAGSVQPPVLIEEGIGTAPREKAAEMVGWKGSLHGAKSGHVRATIYSAAGYMLDGYFEQIQRAMFVTLALRLAVGTAAAFFFWKRYVGGR